MNTPRRFSYFSDVAAMRIVAPRPASTRNHLLPAMIAVAAPAWSGFGRGLPVPRRMRARLSNKLVIDNLRPRFQRLSPPLDRGTRHPFADHFFRFPHAHITAAHFEHIGGAEVNAADVGGTVVDDADEHHVVIRADLHFFVQLFAQPL